MFKNVTGGDKEKYNMWPCIMYNNVFDSNVLTLPIIYFVLYLH